MFIYKKTSSDTKQLFGISSIQPYPKQLDTICEGLPLGQWTVSQSLSFTVGSTPSPRLFRKGSFRVITPGRRQTHCDLNDPIPESYYKPVLFFASFGLGVSLCHLFLWLCSIFAQFDLDYLTPGNTPFLLLASPHCFHLKKESMTCH